MTPEQHNKIVAVFEAALAGRKNSEVPASRTMS